MLIGVDASRTTVPHPTGTEWYSGELLRALLASGSPHRWRLYFRDAPPAGVWPASPPVEQRVIPFPRLWTHVRLSWEMLAAPPDLLFVPAHVLPLVCPRRRVVTVHDLGYHFFPQAHTRSARRYLEWSTRRNARLATLVIADSQATRRDIASVYGTPAEKIRVVYPGRNEAIRRVEDAERIAGVRRKFGLPEEYLLYLGTLQPRKNLVRLIEAYVRVRGRWEGASPCPALVLAGKPGWMSEDILTAPRRLDAEGAVIFPGYIPAEDVPALLSGARAFLFPSLYEGFGFPVLEAMACGTPVLCSNSSSLPEVAGEAALFVDPMDVEDIAAGIQRILTDAPMRVALVERGLRQVERFSWARAARETLAVLEEAGGMP